MLNHKQKLGYIYNASIYTGTTFSDKHMILEMDLWGFQLWPISSGNWTEHWSLGRCHLRFGGGWIGRGFSRDVSREAFCRWNLRLGHFWTLDVLWCFWWIVFICWDFTSNTEYTSCELEDLKSLHNMHPVLSCTEHKWAWGIQTMLDHYKITMEYAWICQNYWYLYPCL